jgi:hypothetical protein
MSDQYNEVFLLTTGSSLGPAIDKYGPGQGAYWIEGYHNEFFASDEYPSTGNPTVMAVGRCAGLGDLYVAGLAGGTPPYTTYVARLAQFAN